MNPQSFQIHSQFLRHFSAPVVSVKSFHTQTITFLTSNRRETPDRSGTQNSQLQSRYQSGYIQDYNLGHARVPVLEFSTVCYRS